MTWLEQLLKAQGGKIPNLSPEAEVWAQLFVIKATARSLCDPCGARYYLGNVKRREEEEEHVTKYVFHSNCIAKVNKADNHIIQQQYACSSEFAICRCLKKVSHDLKQNSLHTEKYRFRSKRIVNTY